MAASYWVRWAKRHTPWQPAVRWDAPLICKYLHAIIAVFLMILATSACTNVKVGQHVAANDYLGSPRRIFIVNRMDARFASSMPDTFAAAAKEAFARCNVAVFVYRPDPTEVDAAEMMKGDIGTFRPDSLLTILQTNRSLTAYGEVDQGTYLVILHDLVGNRDIWRGAISAFAWPLSGGGLLVDRGKVGANVADQLLRSMVQDNAIKTCPPLPPENHS